MLDYSAIRENVGVGLKLIKKKKQSDNAEKLLIKHWKV